MRTNKPQSLEHEEWYYIIAAEGIVMLFTLEVYADGVGVMLPGDLVEYGLASIIRHYCDLGYELDTLADGDGISYAFTPKGTSPELQDQVWMSFAQALMSDMIGMSDLPF